MSTAERQHDLVGELIDRTETEGWGVAFDHNRHGQWRISRIVNEQNLQLVADSDFDTACRLALAEVERLAGRPAPDAAGECTEVPGIGSEPPLAQPRLSAPTWDGTDTN